MHKVAKFALFSLRCRHQRESGHCSDGAADAGHALLLDDVRNGDGPDDDDRSPHGAAAHLGEQRTLRPLRFPVAPQPCAGKAGRHDRIPPPRAFSDAPWLLAGGTPAGKWNDVAAGIVVLALSLRRGRVAERYGGWDRFI